MSFTRAELSTHFRYPAPSPSSSTTAGSTPKANTRAHWVRRLGFSGSADSDAASAASVGSSIFSVESSAALSSTASSIRSVSVSEGTVVWSSAV